MLNGEESVFTAPTTDTTVAQPGNDDYSPISFSPNGIIILDSDQPVQLTSFYIRVGQICSDNGALMVNVRYYLGGSSEAVVS